MPSAYGQKNSIMEKQKSRNVESSTFICTECGDGFIQYCNLITHLAIHGPLESFTFDGSSNGFEVAREYVLQENGTLTVVNGFAQSPTKPASPGILPSHFPLPPPVKPVSPPPPPVKPVSPPPRQLPSPKKDVFRPKPLDVNTEKYRQGHYRCEICSRSFNTLQSLHRHQQYRNTERGYKCTLCCKIFGDRQSLKKHLQDHTHERFHCCDHCGKRFIKEDALSAHKKERHPSPKRKLESYQERKLEKTYPCRKCKLHFFWMSDYQTHSLYHCKGKELDIAFETEVEIEVNSKDTEDGPFQNCHGNGTSIDVNDGESKYCIDASSEIQTESSSRPYRCGLCGDRFQNLADLKGHHLTHQTQEEIALQNEEPQSLSTRAPAPKRRRRGGNPNGKLHPCKQCHRVFNHSSSLSRHMRYHKGTMHTCVFCGRTFPQRCDVRRHYIMYHKAELDKKPGLKHLYAAPENCPASRSVSGQKNKKSCEENDKNSSDSEHASPEDPQKDTQAGKAGRANYKCEECGKKFGLLCVYQRHLRYHKKEPTKCPKCPAEFMNSSSLELHLKNHPDTKEAETRQTYGTAVGDPVFRKGNAEDIEDDCADHNQNGKENSSEVLYECTECTETFSCLETFLEHQTSHGSENNG